MKEIKRKEQFCISKNDKFVDRKGADINSEDVVVEIMSQCASCNGKMNKGHEGVDELINKCKRHGT